MRGLLVVLVCGCAGVAAAPAPAPPPARTVALDTPLAFPGEAMVYDLTFRGLHVARVQVAVGMPGWLDGRPAIIVRSRGVTEGVIALLGEVEWELATTIDLERGAPLRTVEHAVTRFRGKTQRSEQTRGAEPTHSVHSAAAVLRGWRSLPDQRARFELRIDRARLDITLREAARELVAGKPAVRYDGLARAKIPFQLWLSDDVARVPLRLRTATRWGAVTVELVEYEAPRD